MQAMSKGRQYNPSPKHEIAWGKSWMSPTHGAAQRKKPEEPTVYKTPEARLARARMLAKQFGAEKETEETKPDQQDADPQESGPFEQVELF